MATSRKAAKVPYQQTVNLVTRALNETHEATAMRGAAVSSLIAELFDSNAHGNRDEINTICARVSLAKLSLETTARAETYEFILTDRHAAGRVLTVAYEVRDELDRLVNCCLRATPSEGQEKTVGGKDLRF